MALMALGKLQTLLVNDSRIDGLSTMQEGLKKAPRQTGNSYAQICIKYTTWQSTSWWSGHPTGWKRVNKECS